MRRPRLIDAGYDVVAALLVVTGCAAPPVVEPSASPITASSPVAASASDEPSGWIEHATGPTDVVLRFDNLPDHGLGELDGETFHPGPEFSLYGDGTVIYRDELAEDPLAEGPIVRARPFSIGHLNESQVQALLRYALREGGLAGAPERYEFHVDTDDAGHSFFTIHAAGFDKRVEVVGSTSPLQDLADYLRNIDRHTDFLTRVWEPDRFWGLVVAANDWIKLGVLPNVSEIGSAPWPWPEISVSAFVGVASGGLAEGRREMSRDEATTLRLSDNGGVVRRVYFTGTDDGLVYAFSLWPMLPDEVTTPAASSDPTPNPTPSPTPPPSLTPGPLRINGLALVVTDRLRVRSAPEVSDVSLKLDRLLDAGTRLFVIDGPVTGSGYDWYEVAPLDDGSDSNDFRYQGALTGWVARAARDGTPWIVGRHPICPDPRPLFDFDVLVHLGPLFALSCLGGTSIKFIVAATEAGFVDGYGDGNSIDPTDRAPAWLNSNFVYWAPPPWADSRSEHGFESVLDPARFPNGPPELSTDSVWDVVGHFDDRAAVAGSDRPAELTMRTTFVITELDPDPFEGIDPG